jgi:hypothetical protein
MFLNRRESAITRDGIIPIHLTMPKTSDETLGRRRFQLCRELAVEAAIEKIRYAPAAEWHTLSQADYALLRETLGEIWTSLEREKWDRYSFSSLTCHDIRDLISLGHRVKGHGITGSLIDEMDAILSHTRHKPPME